MKKFLSMLLVAVGLVSCGDDDKPYIPKLNKLTSVTCTKNGNAFFNADITYDQDKQINRIILTTEGNQFTDNYIIVDKTISVSGVKMVDGSPTNPFCSYGLHVERKYDCGQGRKIRKQVYEQCCVHRCRKQVHL